MPQQISIEARDLAISYGKKRALELNSLDLSGNIVAIVGHNGAGKSTLIKAILGLIPLTSGTLKCCYNGQLLTPEQDMAFCPEEGAVFGDISVRQYLELWGRLKHGNSKYYRQEGHRYVERFRLGELLTKKGRELSKGQKRRVQAAVGFLSNPKLFLFDEPFDGLDVQRSGELASLMGDESGQRAIIVSSHRMDVVERLADKIIVLRAGMLMVAGTRDQVVAALGGKSYHLRIRTAPAEIAITMQKALPTHYISRIGEILTITGPELTKEKLQLVLSDYDQSYNTWLTATEFDVQIPTLTDAMSLHLRNVELGSSL